MQTVLAPAAAPAPKPKSILWFLLLAFGLTWSFEIALIAGGLKFGPGGNPLAATLMPVANFLPAVAAFIVRKWITREGFADAGFRFGSWKAWLGVWFGAPLLFAAVYGLTYLLGLGQLDLTIAPVMKVVNGQLPPGTPAVPPVLILVTLFLTSITVTPSSTRCLPLGRSSAGPGNPLLGGITGVVGVLVFAAVGALLLARTPEPQP